MRHQMESANQAYLASDFSLAAEQYEQIIISGYESAALYFNLGNAYFKLNQVPAAILYYEKALKLDPADESIRFNVELANSRIIDKIDPLPELFLRTWFRNARNLFSSDLWAKAGVACFIMLLIAILIFLAASSVMVRKISFWAGVFLFVSLSFSMLFSISSYRDYSQKKTGIIFTPTVTVKSSPNENSVDLFVIHEGTRVFITDRVENWSEVRLINGNIGWLKTETYRPI
ncbi:MAG: tetratricopeptide repeat protein [Bacteroidales bacterium]|nr:tetratricopeptide repeat protein [Bacteroidales bacterium]